MKDCRGIFLEHVSFFCEFIFLCYKLGPQKKESKWLRRKKIVRRAWSKEDVRTLKMMGKNKLGVTKIAKALKRSPGATTAMAAKRVVSLGTRD